MDKYNYVILGSDWDLYKFSYSDLYQFNNVQYIPGPYPPINSLKGLLYRIHFNPTINRLVKLPFKTAWNDSYFKHRFPVSKPFCFIVFMNWIKQDVGITTYLREKFPNAKLVCILQDLASTHPFYCNNLKKQFDLVLSFDPGDCATYGFIYHPLVYSSYHGKIKKMPYSDVYMLAKAKNRLNDIFKIYTILKDNNLKPNLLLAGVDIQDQKYKDEITYLNKSIPYEENLQYITFLKGLAILGVILVHAPQLIKEINPLIREFLHAGAFGCQLFFVISGFLAVKSWERLLAKYENSTEKNRTTYKTFLKKRYLSIAPIYILFILFYQIISYYIATFNVEPFYKISHNPLSILANIFLLNGLDYQAFNNIVPGGWFIGTIFLFYLLFPLIYKLYRYIKTYNPRLLFLLPLGGVIVSAIFQTGIFFIIGDWTLSKPGSFTYYSIINQLPCMLIGVTLNYYLKNTKLSKNNLLLCFICLGLIGNLLWYALRLHYWIYALIPSIIGWSFFYLFLYVQRKSEEIRGGETVNNQTRNYITKKIEQIGKVSFSVYFTNFIGTFIFPWGIQLLLVHYGYTINGTLLFFLLLIPIFLITFLFVPPVDYIISRIKSLL